jgi:hypothetical protein
VRWRVVVPTAIAGGLALALVAARSEQRRPAVVYEKVEAWPPAAKREDLLLEATMKPDPPRGGVVRAEVTITNLRDEARAVSRGACVGPSGERVARSLRLRLHRTADRSDRPGWDSGVPSGFCRGVALGMILGPRRASAPGALVLEVPVAAIVPGALPEGTYFATVSIALDEPGTSEEIPAGTVTLPTVK